MNHRISCSEMVLRLDDFVDRALSPADLELVEEHLLECAKCAEKFRFESSLVASLRDRLGRIAAPEGLLQSVRDRLRDAGSREEGAAGP
ncbi:MAG TPA: zf-HC2 domain-containing protein [Gemmatimonadales bacterium]|jgi:anti-sigma factor (TIGR02949 family)|nr:zf-HC2 domain-containing protein [Gemmatimonadales bacterium]